jgi:hypothetical protein
MSYLAHALTQGVVKGQSTKADTGTQQKTDPTDAIPVHAGQAELAGGGGVENLKT